MAIKKVRLITEDADLEKESIMLSKCRSKFIVEYYDVIRMDHELWVRGVVIC